MASLLLDHNLSDRLARLLRRAGHSVATARELQLDRADDSEILRLAGRAGLIVVTADADFADLHQVGRVRHAGILLVRQPRHGDNPAVADALARLLDSGRPLANELYTWSEASGWVREP